MGLIALFLLGGYCFLATLALIALILTFFIIVPIVFGASAIIVGVLSACAAPIMTILFIILVTWSLSWLLQAIAPGRSTRDIVAQILQAAWISLQFIAPHIYQALLGLRHAFCRAQESICRNRRPNKQQVQRPSREAAYWARQTQLLGTATPAPLHRSARHGASKQS